MTDAQDMAPSVGAIADLQRAAEGFKQVAEGMLIWADALIKRVKQLEENEGRDADGREPS
ncbi:MAG: hypothetical protein ACYTEQ_27860 [Planctomycetota bacterium]|jgi:hypothetical protein